MSRKEIEKNKLDLKYNNLLNWRSIIFGLYFVTLGLAGGYLITELGIYDGLVYFILFGFLIWVVFDFFKYDDIKEELESIERRLDNLNLK